MSTVSELKKVTQKPTNVSRLDTLVFYILAAIVFLLPVLVIPVVGVSLPLVKALLILLGGIGALVVWVIARLQSGVIEMPKTWSISALLLVLGVYAVSALFTPTPMMSFFGEVVQIDTVSMLAGMVLLAFVASFAFQNKAHLQLLFLGTASIAGLIGLFHIVRLIFGTEHILGATFSGIFATPLVLWSDLGIFFGLVLMLSLILFSVSNLSWFKKGALYTLSTVSFLIVLVLNLTTVWVALGLFSFIYLVYSLSMRYVQKESPSVFSVSAVGVVLAGVLIVISLTSLISGGGLGEVVSSTFGVQYVEVWPSWSGTRIVVEEVIKDNPLLGVGPNGFLNAWLTYKPLGVNQSLFWNSDFTQGVGRIPSSLVTTGVLGFLAWALFFLAFLRDGFRALFTEKIDSRGRLYISLGFFSALYLWFFAFVNTPGIVVYSLAFIVTGAFIALLVREGVIQTKKFELGTKASSNFIIVLCAVLLIVGGLMWGYLIGERAVARVIYERALSTLNTGGDLVVAEQSVEHALAFHSVDRYYRTLAEIRAARLSQILSNENLSDDVRRSQFQEVLAAAVTAGEQAIAEDTTNYRNYITLGGVYEVLVPAEVEGAYERARALYEEAQKYNPRGPALYLTLARLEAQAGNLDIARTEIGNALRVKPNYTEAIFMLSQIEVAAGNIDNAIQAVESATVISPNDATVYFQLGLLRYNDKQFTGSIGAFENAVRLNPAYSNARYFLGLSYEEKGRTADAIQQFEMIAELNPHNQEVQFILENLRAGRAPFAGAVPPLDENPEVREDLPIEE
jgi:tetratricopeptide (TPR) repeat protein